MNALDDFATCDKCKIMTISLHCIKDYKVSCVIVNKENKEGGKFSATTFDVLQNVSKRSIQNTNLFVTLLMAKTFETKFNLTDIIVTLLVASD